MYKKPRKDYFLRSVLNALAILEQFHDETDELTLTQLSRCTNLSKNNVFRLLATLESRSYVEHDRSNEHYRLGIKNYELAAVRLKQTELMEQCRPVMELLSEECSETVCLAIGAGSEIYYPEVIPSPLLVRVVLQDRTRLYPAHATAAGKVILAGRWDGGASSLPFADLRACTPRTITDRETLLTHLKGVLETGYATDDEEAEVGVRSVAAPVCDHNQEVVAALTVLGPATRLSDERIETLLAPLVARCAETVSRGLGFHTPQPQLVGGREGWGVHSKAA